MSRFFEKYLKKENVDNVDCACEERNKKSVNSHKRVKNAFLSSCVQSTKSTKHQFPACTRCLNYSWKAEGNLFRPWCKKINKPVFGMKECPIGKWHIFKTITINEDTGKELKTPEFVKIPG